MSHGVAQDRVEAIGELEETTRAQSGYDRTQLGGAEYQVNLIGLDVRRLSSHGSIGEFAGQTFGVVTANEKGCAFGILESLTRECLDVVAVFIGEAPGRTVIGKFADAFHLHVDKKMDDCLVRAVDEPLRDSRRAW
jgi:hypothetical protein